MPRPIHCSVRLAPRLFMLLVVLGTLVGDLLLFRHTSKAAVVPQRSAVEPKVDGTVYVGSADHNVYALNARTGTKVWSFSTPDYVDSSPRVVDGIVYVGSNAGGVFALKARTGAQVWWSPTGDSGYHSTSGSGRYRLHRLFVG